MPPAAAAFAERPPVLVTGPHWQAEHAAERVGGPRLLSTDGVPLLSAVRFQLGDVSDELALGRGARRLRKHHGEQVVSSGTLPFGAGIEFRHTVRYGGALMRQTTDLLCPKGTRLRGRVALGVLTLPGDWRQVRELRATASGAGQLTDWQPLTPATPLAWPVPPLAIILQRADGTQLELGGGYDLWRWQRGLDLPGQSCQWTLAHASDGWHFARVLAQLPEETDARPVPLRLSWYAAWQRPAQAATPPSVPSATTPVPWRATGEELDMAALRASPPAPGAALCLDLRLVPWPLAARRQANAALPADDQAPPCLAAGPVMVRLHRAMRQLAAWPEWQGPLVLAGIAPGLCHAGNHVDKKGARAHWDLSELHDLWTWAGHTLGPGRLHLALTPETPITPALLALFAGE